MPRVVGIHRAQCWSQKLNKGGNVELSYVSDYEETGKKHECADCGMSWPTVWVHTSDDAPRCGDCMCLYLMNQDSNL